MQKKANQVCLVISNTNVFHEVEFALGNNYSVIRNSRIDEAYNFLRINAILCIIIQIDGDVEKSPTPLASLRNQFPGIPMIGLSTEFDLEAIRRCGEIGMESVLSINEISTLSNLLKSIVHNKYKGISLTEFGVEREQCSVLVQKALTILENNYLKLCSVQEIAEILGVSQVTLATETNNCIPVGLKRLLIYLKVKHAVFLMRNPGLSLKEIAIITGFSDQRRFNECFHRIFGTSPTRCRRGILISGIQEFWESNFKLLPKEEKGIAKFKKKNDSPLGKNVDKIYGYESYYQTNSRYFKELFSFDFSIDYLNFA